MYVYMCDLMHINAHTYVYVSVCMWGDTCIGVCVGKLENIYCI